MSRIYGLYIDESVDHSYGKKELQRLRLKLQDKTIDYPMSYSPKLEKEGDKNGGVNHVLFHQERVD